MLSLIGYQFMFLLTFACNLMMLFILKNPLEFMLVLFIFRIFLIKCLEDEKS
jgi:hypothetical protein